jgi:curved DNA-binding protein CbpA
MAVESPDLDCRTYYDVLGLPNSSTPVSMQEIKVAYHRALLTVHPDKVVGATGAQVDLVREAWRVLSDEKLRTDYDARLNGSSMELWI